MAKSESVSFFFPAYYDEKSIPLLVKDFDDALKKSGRDYEILIIDDCSPDNTGKVADELAKKFKKVKVIHHDKNRGYGGALTSGFLNASKDFVGFTDGDGQFNVSELGKFLDNLSGNDLVIGYRLNRAEGFKRAVIQNTFKALLLLLFGLRFKDPDCGFKFIRRKVFGEIAPVSRSGFFSAEMLYRTKKKALKVKEVPVNHLNRKFGSSTFLGFGRVLETLQDMVKMRFGKL